MVKTADIAGTAAIHMAAAAAVLFALLAIAGCTTTGLIDRPAASGVAESTAVADRTLSYISGAGESDLDAIETGGIGVPGVFGSVAIPIRNFPVAARWAPVNRAIQECAVTGSCGDTSDLLDRAAAKMDGKTLVEKLGIANAAVNAAILYRADRSVYGELDHWATPGEIMSRGSGDCEDFAILKMTALLRAGLPARSLSLVVLRDNRRGVFHAVLAVATNSGSFILDNTRTGVAMDAGLPDYQPLFSFSGERAWIHGTRATNRPALAQDTNLSSIAPGEGPAATSGWSVNLDRPSVRPAGSYSTIFQ
jgi:predicted transglutaminase-like cysteine proteinase